ncbi:MAG: NAD(P)H-binding protein, partial [Spirochaetales bacterium]|nr:NAD(P)H-binding protein [Spirochaetales bacterium]
MDVITGASGHLGNTLLRELAAAGRTVKPLFRSPPSFEMPDGVTPYYCDPEEPDALAQAFLGAETVYHTAGFVSFALNS